MRVLILGGDGMLGHQLLKSLASVYELKVTLRQELAAYRRWGLFSAHNSFDQLDVRDIERVAKVVRGFSPEIIVNAVGVVKQRAAAKEAIPSLEINSLLPHRLAEIAKAVSARLFHFSTDCVFSGRKGAYTESDVPDAEDLYGRTKLLGELDYPHCFTLRTSIIGRELGRAGGLLEWFLAQQGSVRGFRGAIYTGFTTAEMARILDLLIRRFPSAHGVWHVSSDIISKFDLLMLARRCFDKEIEITPDDEFKCERSLDSSRFRAAFGYVPPTWQAMIEELALESRTNDAH